MLRNTNTLYFSYLDLPTCTYQLLYYLFFWSFGFYLFGQLDHLLTEKALKRPFTELSTHHTNINPSKRSLPCQLNFHWGHSTDQAQARQRVDPPAREASTWGICDICHSGTHCLFLGQYFVMPKLLRDFGLAKECLLVRAPKLEYQIEFWPKQRNYKSFKLTRQGNRGKILALSLITFRRSRFGTWTQPVFVRGWMFD